MRRLFTVADWALYVVHTIVMFFCLLGWIPPGTRGAHLVAVALIGFSWAVLGWFKGFGYCLLTDLQWNVKRRLGRAIGHNSFVKYQLDQLTGFDIRPQTADRVAYLGLVVALIGAALVNVSWG